MTTPPLACVEWHLSSPRNKRECGRVGRWNYLRSEGEAEMFREGELQ